MQKATILTTPDKSVADKIVKFMNSVIGSQHSTEKVLTGWAVTGPAQPVTEQPSENPVATWSYSITINGSNVTLILPYVTEDQAWIVVRLKAGKTRSLSKSGIESYSVTPDSDGQQLVSIKLAMELAKKRGWLALINKP